MDILCVDAAESAWTSCSDGSELPSTDPTGPNRTAEDSGLSQVPRSWWFLWNCFLWNRWGSILFTSFSPRFHLVFTSFSPRSHLHPTHSSLTIVPHLLFDPPIPKAPSCRKERQLERQLADASLSCLDTAVRSLGTSHVSRPQPPPFLQGQMP